MAHSWLFPGEELFQLYLMALLPLFPASSPSTRNACQVSLVGKPGALLQGAGWRPGVTPDRWCYWSIDDVHPRFGIQVWLALFSLPNSNRSPKNTSIVKEPVRWGLLRSLLLGKLSGVPGRPWWYLKSVPSLVTVGSEPSLHTLEIKVQD
jgi:hypothetical protein